MFRHSIKVNHFQAFKKVFGHLKIVPKFIIPNTSEWPEESRGFKLGIYQETLRSKIKNKNELLNNKQIRELIDLGFILDPRESHKRMLIRAFQSFRSNYADRTVPHTFEVPKEEDWPVETHGLKLGTVFHGIRKLRSHKEIHETLKDLGYDTSKPTRVVRSFERVYNALKTYKTINGHLKIPQAYEVPEDDMRYHANARGMQLGVYLGHIIHGNSYKKHKAKLLALGVNYESKSYLTRVGLDVLSTSFKAYQQLYQHTNIPRDFIVPSEDLNFPERTWGFNLGEVVCNMKESTIGSIMSESNLFNVRVKSASKRNSYFEVIYTSLEAYKKLYGNLDVVFSFEIPSNFDFPIHTWGLPLGKTVQRIRRGCFREHKERLLALGLSYKQRKTIPFETLYEALQRYKDIHGHITVPANYVIGDDDEQYPKETRGIKLGFAYQNIRNKGAYSEYHDRLIELGITIVQVVPKLDLVTVFPAFVAFKDIHGHMNIPAVFRVPVDDERYPVDTRGVALGKYVHKIRNENAYADHPLKAKIFELGLPKKGKSGPRPKKDNKDSQ